VVAGREDSFLLKEALNPRHEYALIELERRYPGVLRLSETMSVTDYAQPDRRDAKDFAKDRGQRSKRRYSTVADHSCPN
jgi:hypothetical protein